MKKITITILFILISTSFFAQMCQKYRYHKFLKLGRSYEIAFESNCLGTNFGIEKANLFGLKLELNKIYRANLGDGDYFYKVIYVQDTCSDAGLEVDDTSNIEEVTLLSCSSISWKYHKFIRLGSLSEAQSKICSSDIKGMQFKTNIYIGAPLVINKVYHLDLGDGNGLKYYYLILSAYTSSDPDYEILGSSFNNSSISFDCDSDSDGVPDSQDNCPNQAGPASNNGCPVQQGKPDFIITEIKVNGIAAPNLKLKANSNNKFCVSIKNIGSATGTIDNTALILTNNAGLTNSSIVANLPYPSTSLTIAPNEVKEMCAELYIWNDYLGYSLSSFHYIHAIADYHERVSESDENNNTTVESIGYSSKTAIISVNNFQGIEIKRETIKNSEEEKELLNRLPKGFYILNKDGKRTKIYKEN
ncbi:hypothetical protein ACQY1Q_07605 [Tenacibaculum sp. TC6]|uniref:hypothetical protein n=1 Tax=Tenacibaculum sp. TC6 TaxID=3423223 RepID=UPI003D369F37